MPVLVTPHAEGHQRNCVQPQSRPFAHNQLGGVRELEFQFELPPLSGSPPSKNLKLTGWKATMPGTWCRRLNRAELISLGHRLPDIALFELGAV
jgi:hypothetical protein